MGWTRKQAIDAIEKRFPKIWNQGVKIDKIMRQFMKIVGNRSCQYLAQFDGRWMTVVMYVYIGPKCPDDFDADGVYDGGRARIEEENGSDAFTTGHLIAFAEFLHVCIENFGEESICNGIENVAQ